jgi:hypothetical protein
MLTKGDDYPIHQTPDPVAYSGSDRNFYDRYFFNGHSAAGDMFFATALGVYPHLNIMDAAFGVRIGNIQYNLHVSRHLNMERMDTVVGPIRVQVIEPLKTLRIVVDDPEHRIAADVLFEGRIMPIEEPRVTRRNGPRMLMDFTRLTQPGRYSGWIRAGGHEFPFQGRNVTGVRDRSWGVRAVGLPDSQPPVPAATPQFYWLWVPMSFEDRVVLFYLNEDADGKIWNRGCVMCHDGCAAQHLQDATIEVDYQPGTRWPSAALVTMTDGAAGKYTVQIKPGPKFFMTGIGYMNPEWGHGFNKGELAIGYDEIRGEEVSVCRPPHVYVEAFSHISLTTSAGAVLQGVGVIESLSIGQHAPTGFTGMFEAP